MYTKAEHMDVACLGFFLLFMAPPPADCSKGIPLYEQKRPQESLLALSRCPPTAETLFYMGLDHRVLGHHREARKLLLAALQAGRDDASLLYALIEEENELGQKAAGLEHFQSMLRRYPDSAWTHVLLGNAYYTTEQDQKAQGEYEQAIARDSKLPNVNFRLGYLAYRAAQYESAERFFRRELERDPSHAPANLFYGQTLKTLGRNAEAIGYLRKAIALDRQSAVTYRTLAGALTAENQQNEAVTLLRQAEKLFPSDPTFPAMLSRVYAGMQLVQEAHLAAERARALTAMKQKKGQLTSK